MSKSTDSSSSPLIAHLKELNIIASENTNVAQTASPQPVVSKPIVDQTVETKPAVTQTVSTDASVTNNSVVGTKAPEKKVKEKKNKEKKSSEQDMVETSVKVKEDKTKIKTETSAPVTPPKPVVVKLSYDQRKEKLMQTVNAQSDSLLLSFYDNGVVDGDSISVYLNGQPVLTNERLKSTATRKMIYVGNLDEMRLLLVAENLGTLPPNTGLLMIKDGEQSYQVNFSADMQTNALIVIRRKK